MQKVKLASFLVIILIGGELPQFKLESICIFVNDIIPMRIYYYVTVNRMYSLLKMKCDGSYILGVSHKKKKNKQQNLSQPLPPQKTPLLFPFPGVSLPNPCSSPENVLK